MKTVDSVDALIKNKKAKVFTASEIKEKVRQGKPISPKDVDVVTCGTFGIMSGTMALISLSVAGAGAFTKVDAVTFNGVPGTPGPCPNENLGVVDCLVYGTSHRDHRYGGGHLFKDIVSGEKILVDVTSEGKHFTKEVTIKDIPFAKIIVTRGAFRNYTAFYNEQDNVFETIFSVTGIKGPLKEMSVSGCGELNPLQNDSGSYLKEGASILVNGSPGMILGSGTRSSAARPNLSALADMKKMDPEMMGGFITSAGPECLTSFAVAIPILDESSAKGVQILDDNIEIPIAEIHQRSPRSASTYKNIWEGTSKKISVNAKKCLNCRSCVPEEICPTEALQRSKLDDKKCVVCGSCVQTCTGNIFFAEFGSMEHLGVNIPITLRQSDRNRAEELTVRLKKLVQDGEWGLRC